jgi:hypothetical protein
MLNEIVVSASAARCPRCPAWVILTSDRCHATRPGAVETTCPICKDRFEVENHDCKLWEIPEKWLARGYFYKGELDSLCNS